MSDCIEYQGATNAEGYGRKWLNGGETTAHRAAYIAAYGPESVVGLDVDHFVCDNRLCINAEHLKAVTHKDNVARSMAPTAINGRKTHCDSGHAFTSANTYTKYGYRYCKTCHKERAREYRARQRRASLDSVAA